MDETQTTLLPVFPLALVLVPGELLPLHIFEERYKALMRDALEGSRRFGLSYVARAEVGVDTPPAVGTVGCEAQITAVIPLPDGRMNILSVGAGRYVVRGYSQLEPFLVAEVTKLADEPDDSPETAALAAHVRDLFERLATAARTLSNEAADQVQPQLDVAPEPLSFLVAANIALDSATKQQMLEMTATRPRLENIEARLADLVDTYEYRAEMHGRTKSNGHGRKMPELEDEEDEES
jgi:Lon protease-like protein